MAEYIEREAAIKAVYLTILHDGIRDALKSNIDDVPAADVQPVRHGRWIIGATMHHDWMKCSECLVSQDVNGCFSYCPNCGALMDAEVDE